MQRFFLWLLLPQMATTLQKIKENGSKGRGEVNLLR